MAGLYSLTLSMPGLRDFFELDVPPLEASIAVAVAVAIGGIGVVAATLLVGDVSGGRLGRRGQVESIG